ncbi:MAG TPA: hypothetical protein EYQ64_13905, partial [Gemmatimonadetes bacterium]|nr:hypothetical protein [Gemmatimonadota bacterium]
MQIWQINPERVTDPNRPNGNRDFTLNGLSYEAYSEQNRTLSGIAYVSVWWSSNEHIAVGGGGRAPEWVAVQRVSPSFFSVLGIEPVLGRAFLPEEEELGRPPQVTILSHDIWVRLFGSDPDIIGRQISLNAGSATVVGVLPERFALPPISLNAGLLSPDAGIYAPLPNPAFKGFARTVRSDFLTLARIAPGHSARGGT